jgi:hypothetical protein
VEESGDHIQLKARKTTGNGPSVSGSRVAKEGNQSKRPGHDKKVLGDGASEMELADDCAERASTGSGEVTPTTTSTFCTTDVAGASNSQVTGPIMPEESHGRHPFAGVHVAVDYSLSHSPGADTTLGNSVVIGAMSRSKRWDRLDSSGDANDGPWKKDGEASQ